MTCPSKSSFSFSGFLDNSATGFLVREPDYTTKVKPVDRCFDYTTVPVTSHTTHVLMHRGRYVVPAAAFKAAAAGGGTVSYANMPEFVIAAGVSGKVVVDVSPVTKEAIATWTALFATKADYVSAREGTGPTDGAFATSGTTVTDPEGRREVPMFRVMNRSASPAYVYVGDGATVESVVPSVGVRGGESVVFAFDVYRAVWYIDSKTN